MVIILKMTMTLKVCWIYLFSHSLINDFDADDDDDVKNDDVEGLVDKKTWMIMMTMTLKVQWTKKDLDDYDADVDVNDDDDDIEGLVNLSFFTFFNQ